jgi:hypothetical protein
LFRRRRNFDQQWPFPHAPLVGTRLSYPFSSETRGPFRPLASLFLLCARRTMDERK